MQFGAAGFRLLHEIVRVDPSYGPVYMAKNDLSDAYMRVWLALKDFAKLVFVVPSLLGETDILIGFHLSLPMGLVNSCLHFCVVTETIVDLGNVGDASEHPLHPLEHLANTPPLPGHECYIAPSITASDDTRLENFFARAPEGTGAGPPICKHLHQRLRRPRHAPN